MKSPIVIHGGQRSGKTWHCNNPTVETGKRASDSLDPLARLHLSAYLKEECQGCHKAFETLDDLMDAVWWPWAKGRVGHKACFQANAQAEPRREKEAAMEAERTPELAGRTGSAVLPQRPRVLCHARENVAPGIWYCVKAGVECDQQERGGCVEMSRRQSPNAPGERLPGKPTT